MTTEAQTLNQVDHDTTKGTQARRRDSGEEKPPVQAPDDQRKRSRMLASFMVVLAIAAIGGLLYWLHVRHYEDTDDAEIEVLPVLNSDGSVVVMVADHAINSPEDNNGPGAPRSVLVDVSALGTFSSGTQLAINAETNAVSGPTASSFAPAPQLTVTFGGYGVTFLMLKP